MVTATVTAGHYVNEKKFEDDHPVIFTNLQNHNIKIHTYPSGGDNRRVRTFILKPFQSCYTETLEIACGRGVGAVCYYYATATEPNKEPYYNALQVFLGIGDTDQIHPSCFYDKDDHCSGDYSRIRYGHIYSWNQNENSGWYSPEKVPQNDRQIYSAKNSGRPIFIGFAEENSTAEVINNFGGADIDNLYEEYKKGSMKQCSSTILMGFVGDKYTLKYSNKDNQEVVVNNDAFIEDTPPVMKFNVYDYPTPYYAGTFDLNSINCSISNSSGSVNYKGSIINDMCYVTAPDDRITHIKNDLDDYIIAKSGFGDVIIEEGKEPYYLIKDSVRVYYSSHRGGEHVLYADIDKHCKTAASPLSLKKNGTTCEIHFK